MKWTAAPLVLGALAAAAGGALAASEIAAPAPEVRSRELADRFQQELLAALGKAMAEGGPVQAVRVCSELAPQIADRLSRESGAVVRRTSLRPRNPRAAPDDHERRVMESLAAAPLGPDGKPAESFGWTGDGDARRFRYMRAIPTAPMCTTCHGVEIAPEVAAAIRSTYPGDQATGFRPGDLRGAFSITWDQTRAP